MTTKTLEKIRELHKCGLSDLEIAKKIGCGTTTVWNWRQKMGLPAKWKATPKQFYVIYDKKDNVRAAGSARECAAVLGIRVDSVYHAAYIAGRKGNGRVVVNK